MINKLSEKGVDQVLCESCEALKWKSPTKIQIEAIPVALSGIQFLNVQFILNSIQIISMI